MKYTDYTKIKNITFNVPELIGKDAKDNVINLFNKILSLKDEISTLRMEATKKDAILKNLEEKWNLILPLINIEYETLEKEDINETVNLTFNFGTDINKNIH